MPTTSGNDFLVNTYTTGTQQDSSVTALNDGGFVITWSSDGQDGDGDGIYGQRYDASGNKTGSEFRINTTTASYQFISSVTALKDGGFVVTWTSLGQDGYSDIYGQRYDASGNTAGSEFPINTYTISDQQNPSVTALKDGGFVVTWTSLGQDGSRWGVYGQRYDASGNPTGSEFRINTTTAIDQQDPSVTALNDGGFFVTWTSYSLDISNSADIYGQRYDASGNPTGSEFVINTTTYNMQTEASVTALKDGGFVVTWNSLGQDNSDLTSGIYGQRFDASGNPTGSEFPINTTTANQQEWSSVTALNDGGFFVTWTSYGQDGDGYGIFGQQLDISGN